MKGTTTNTGGPTDDAEAAREAGVRNNTVIFKNCAPFIDCINEISNTQVDNVDVSNMIHILTEYSNNQSKTSGSLWQCDRCKTHDAGIVNSESFKSKIRITRKNLADGNTKDIEKVVSLKYFRNFQRPF